MTKKSVLAFLCAEFSLVLAAAAMIFLAYRYVLPQLEVKSYGVMVAGVTISAIVGAWIPKKVRFAGQEDPGWTVCSTAGFAVGVLVLTLSMGLLLNTLGS